MNREEFLKQAQSVIGDGSKARADAARALAKQFLAGSADFRPQDLQKLGTSGLRYFLRSIDRGDLTANPKTKASTYQVEITSTTDSKQHGWASERRSEPFWLLRAIFYGAGAGLALLVLSITAFQYLNFWG